MTTLLAFINLSKFTLGGTKYIQLSFSDLKTRKQIFGDSWKIFKADDYDSIAIGIDNNDLPQSIADIINDTPEDFFLEADGEEDESEEDKKIRNRNLFQVLSISQIFYLLFLKFKLIMMPYLKVIKILHWVIKT